MTSSLRAGFHPSFFQPPSSGPAIPPQGCSVDSKPTIGGSADAGAGLLACRTDDAAPAVCSTVQMEQPAAVVYPPTRRAPKKVLKLTDDEILDLYRFAQAEAAHEADWRGIIQDARSGASTARSQEGAPASSGYAEDSQGQGAEYLRLLSRAMQEPGPSPMANAVVPRVVQAADEASAASGIACCQPRISAVVQRVMAHAPPCSSPDDRGDDDQLQISRITPL
eukprot:gb/GFBE01020888.1/.p1 GENE.gb/GFBE01020888.1/~~gb/GFBE01020888.1/.p1  ORF type:complete len:223 (+),score=39.27 gb/GFBE01020888.1/:1-669(+)